MQAIVRWRNKMIRVADVNSAQSNGDTEISIWYDGHKKHPIHLDMHSHDTKCFVGSRLSWDEVKVLATALNKCIKLYKDNE